MDKIEGWASVIEIGRTVKENGLGRYYLNRITGETIDQNRESLSDWRRKTKDWPIVLISISKKVFDILNRNK